MMHELAVTESILEIATQAAKERAATKVTDIYLRLGQLSSIVDESVQFYWDVISQGTLAEAPNCTLRMCRRACAAKPAARNSTH